MSTAQHSYIGKGSVYVDGRPVGNCTSLSFSPEEETQTLQDYENPGGGALDEVSRITRVGISMTLSNFSPENLALALRGASTAQASVTAIADEAHTVSALGKLVKLDRIPNLGETLTVKEAGVGGATFDAGVDYDVVGAGIIPKVGGTIAASDELLISYTPVASNLVQAMVASGQEFHFLFDGLNEAKSGKKVIVEAYKVKFSPTAALDLIGDEFGELVLEGALTKDSSKTGVGISQYFTANVQSL